MDEHFKFWYETYVFSLLPKLESDWTKQISKINDLWEIVGSLIDKKDFKESYFTRSDHLLCKTYNFEEGFRKANSAWKKELIQRVVDIILEYYQY